MPLTQRGRQHPGGLAENREVVGDSLLRAAVGLEGLLALRGQRFDVGERVAHVREPIEVSPRTQRGIASRSICARVRSRA
jgi:hypothetical protein